MAGHSRKRQTHTVQGLWYFDTRPLFLYSSDLFVLYNDSAVIALAGGESDGRGGGVVTVRRLFWSAEAR